MPKGHHHLTYDKRCQINALLKRDFTQKEIAEDLEVSQSSISREIKRNSGKRGYRYKQADERAKTRRRQASSKIGKMTKIAPLVENLLCAYKWSPEQISGRLKQEEIMISHEAIYQHIWADKMNDGVLYKSLRNRGKKYNKRNGKTSGRGVIPNRVGIEHRPKIVERKSRVGDFELDTIVGSKHRGAIVSVVDRKTKLVRLALLDHATATKTAAQIVDLLDPIKSFVHTLTSDNGKEFAQHEIVASKLEASFYFANPYHAWERGLNENTNRLVRQYFPKSTDFSIITNDQVKYVEFLLNNRPRKLLNFKTPIETFYRLTGTKLNYAFHG